MLLIKNVESKKTQKNYLCLILSKGGKNYYLSWDRNLIMNLLNISPSSYYELLKDSNYVQTIEE
jgi:hypothetical protein